MSGRGAHWLHLLPRSKRAQPYEYQDEHQESYLSRPLTAPQHQSQWWMPAEFVASPFVLEHCVRPRPSQSGEDVLSDLPTENWWAVRDSTRRLQSLAEFRLPAMTMAFKAAKLYRLTHTYRDLAPGVPVTLKEEGSEAVVAKTPRTHHLTRYSTITITLPNEEERSVSSAELGWRTSVHSKKNKRRPRFTVLRVIQNYITEDGAFKAPAGTTNNIAEA